MKTSRGGSRHEDVNLNELIEIITRERKVPTNRNVNTDRVEFFLNDYGDTVVFQKPYRCTDEDTFIKSKGAKLKNKALVKVLVNQLIELQGLKSLITQTGTDDETKTYLWKAAKRTIRSAKNPKELAQAIAAGIADSSFTGDDIVTIGLLDEEDEVFKFVVGNFYHCGAEEVDVHTREGAFLNPEPLEPFSKILWDEDVPFVSETGSDDQVCTLRWTPKEIEDS